MKPPPQSFRGDGNAENDLNFVDEDVFKMSDNIIYPNWGSLRRLPIGRNKPSNCKDFWEKQALKSDLTDGGKARFKWIRHHVSERKTLFTPSETKADGPNPTHLLKSRATHVYASNSEMMEVSYDDDWTNPMMSNFALERSWNGNSIFIEESPI